MRHRRIIVLLLLVSFLQVSFQSCRSDFNPPEIKSSYPTANADGIPNDVTVWVEFSEEMDRPWTETAFSLFSESDRPRGEFSWQGNRMSFKPRGSLTTGRVYTMLVSKTAEDTSGNNLRDDFQVNFTVNPDSTKPYIISTNPVYGQTGVLPTSVLTFVFSKPIDQTSLIPGITITPSVIGAFALNPVGDTVTFTPQSNLLNGTVYTVNINTNVKDLAGNQLLQGQTISFVVGTDYVRPTILSAVSDPLAAYGGIVSFADGQTISNVSRNAPISVTFSELMNTSMLGNAITISPSVGFSKVFNTVGISTVATLTFSPPLNSETLYTLTVSNSATDVANNVLNQSYNFQFYTDAADSQRPLVVGVRQATTVLNSGICTLSAGSCPSAAMTPCPGPPGDYCDNQALWVGGPEIVGLVAAMHPAPPLPIPPAPPGTVRLQNDTLDINEQVDVDPAVSTTKFRVILNVYFSRQMDLGSLIQATTFTPVISGVGVINISDIKLDATQTMMRVYISGWGGGAGYYKLKIAGGVAKDINNNTLLNDYVLFTY